MSRRLPSPSVGLRVVARQLASQPGIFVSVAVMVLLAALALTALPRALDDASREDLTGTLTGAPVQTRNISVLVQHMFLPSAGDDAFAEARTWGEEFIATQASERVRRVVGSSDLVATSPKYSVAQLPGERVRPTDPVFFEFRHQDAAWELAEVVEGRLPGDADPVTVELPCEEEPCRPVALPRVEVAMTEQTAALTHLQVGDRVLLLPDLSDQMWIDVPRSEIPGIRLVMEVVGIISLPDPEEDVWFQDRRLHSARWVFVTLDDQWTEATALIGPEGYLDALTAQGGSPPYWRYEWRFFLDPERVAASDFAAIGDEVLRLRIANSQTQAGTRNALVSSSLPELIDQHLAKREQSLRVMALTVAGMVATVTAALLALGQLSAERQRPQIILSRDRGASATQVIVSRLYQAAATTVVPAAAAYLATSRLFPGTRAETPYLMTVLLVVAAAVAFVVPVWGLAKRPLGTLRAEITWPPVPNPRRVVFEIALVVLAAACVLLVRRRDPATAVGFDWLLVATPAIVGAAVGALVIRLASPLASALSWVAARMRGAVGFVALRNVVQQAASTRIPLAVLVVSMAASAVSVVLTGSIADGQEQGSWRTVGADYVVSASPLPDDLTAFGGADTVPAASLSVRAELQNFVAATGVFALDTGRHADVFGDTPARVPRIETLAEPTQDGLVPVVASSAWTSRTRPFVGAKMVLPLGEVQVDAVVVDIIEEFAGLRPPFVIADMGLFGEVSGAPLVPTHLLLSGPRSVQEGLADAAAAAGAELVSRYDVLDELATDPLVVFTARAMNAVSVIAAVVGVASMVASFAITAARRRRDLAYLSTLGLRRTQAAAMSLVEQLPGTVLALALGLVAGVVTILAIRPALDLSSMTGQRTTAILVDWPALGVLFGLALAVLAATGVIFVLVNRSHDLGQAMRVGEER